MLVQLAMYFAFGVICEALVVGYYSSLTRGWALRASLLSMSISAFSLGAIVSAVASGSPLPVLAAYVLGVGVGCFAVVRLTAPKR